jgi:hypothetical protein
VNINSLLITRLLFAAARRVTIALAANRLRAESATRVPVRRFL